MIQYRGGPGIRFGGAKLFISLILFLPLPIYLFSQNQLVCTMALC